MPAAPAHRRSRYLRDRLLAFSRCSKCLHVALAFVVRTSSLVRTIQVDTRAPTHTELSEILGVDTHYSTIYRTSVFALDLELSLALQPTGYHAFKGSLFATDLQYMLVCISRNLAPRRHFQHHSRVNLAS